MIIGAQNFSAKTVDAAWAWYCLDILDLLELRAWYDDYDENPLSPWPHRYLAQDVTQAFVTMSLFFPNVEVTKLVREYLDSEEGSQFKKSRIFDPISRSQETLDRRSRTSQSQKPASFFKDLEELEECESMIDSYPMDWSKAVRPIIAKCKSRSTLHFMTHAPTTVYSHLVPQCTGLASSSHPTRNHTPTSVLDTRSRRRSPTARASWTSSCASNGETTRCDTRQTGSPWRAGRTF